MLKQEVLQEEDFMGKYFGQKFHDAIKKEAKPLDEETMHLFISLMMGGELKEGIKEDELPFLVQLIIKRMRYSLDLEIDLKMALVLAQISKNPGTAVMWCTYLKWWSLQNPGSKIDLGLFCERIIPMGIPPESVLHKIWDEQKIERNNGMRSDNMLDYYRVEVKSEE